MSMRQTWAKYFANRKANQAQREVVVEKVVEKPVILAETVKDAELKLSKLDEFIRYLHGKVIEDPILKEAGHLNYECDDFSLYAVFLISKADLKLNPFEYQSHYRRLQFPVEYCFERVGLVEQGVYFFIKVKEAGLKKSGHEILSGIEKITPEILKLPTKGTLFTESDHDLIRDWVTVNVKEEILRKIYANVEDPRLYYESVILSLETVSGATNAVIRDILFDSWKKATNSEKLIIPTPYVSPQEQRLSFTLPGSYQIDQTGLGRNFNSYSSLNGAPFKFNVDANCSLYSYPNSKNWFDVEHVTRLDIENHINDVLLKTFTEEEIEKHKIQPVIYLG